MQPNADPPVTINVRGVRLELTRPLVITGLRADGKYTVVQQGSVRELTPHLFKRLCDLAWSVYSNPPEGWWYYKTEDHEPAAVYKAFGRLRKALKTQPLIENDRGGCYRLTLPWDAIQWHVESLRTIVNEDVNKALRKVFNVLGV